MSSPGETCQYFAAPSTPLNEETDKLTWWPHSSLHPTPTLLLATTDIKVMDTAVSVKALSHGARFDVLLMRIQIESS